MIKLCIFDLDGTTVNSLSSIAHFANETLAAFGYPPFPTDDYRRLAGGGARRLMRNLTDAVGAPESEYEPMLKDWLARYTADYLYLTEPYDGVRSMLADLREDGVRTAILTNKHKEIAESVVAATFGTDGGSLIDALVSDYPGMALKPLPDEIWQLAARFGTDRDECIYCGDHTIDMETGRAAGVHTVGVTWGFHTRDALMTAGADITVDKPSQITEYVRSLGGSDKQDTQRM